jgi:hypothetical protein
MFVAADSSAEYLDWCYLRDIRRMNPPLHHITKIAKFQSLTFINH